MPCGAWANSSARTWSSVSMGSAMGNELEAPCASSGRALMAGAATGAAVAAGAAAATNEWMLFVHADTLLAPGWLAAAESFARASAESRELGPQDRSYAYLPMTHIFGLGTVLMASMYAGAGLLMRSKFDPADVFEALTSSHA